MDIPYKKYLVLAGLILVVVYGIAHVDQLREKVLGLPPLSG